LKSTFYEIGQEEPGIVAERKPEWHRETRRLLSHGFSATALKDQEDVIQQYVDLFVDQLAKLGGVEEGVNIGSVRKSALFI
jgi:cytochrome P450